MWSLVYFVLVFTAAILECHSYGVSAKQRSVSRSRYDRFYRSCTRNSCPRGFECRKRRRLLQARTGSCLPDIRSAIREGLDKWERGWNTGQLERVEMLFTADAVILPEQAPLLKGRAGFGNLLTQLITRRNYASITWALDTFDILTDDHVNAVVLLQIESAVNNPTVFGKAFFQWRRVEGVYFVQYFAVNFDS